MKAFFGMIVVVLLVATMLFVSLPGTALALYDTKCDQNNNVVYIDTGKIKENCGAKKCVSGHLGAWCQPCDRSKHPNCCNQHVDCASVCKRCVATKCKVLTGTYCNDGDKCTENDVCHSNGSCKGKKIKNISPYDPECD